MNRHHLKEDGGGPLDPSTLFPSLYRAREEVAPADLRAPLAPAAVVAAGAEEDSSRRQMLSQIRTFQSRAPFGSAPMTKLFEERFFGQGISAQGISAQGISAQEISAQEISAKPLSAQEIS